MHSLSYQSDPASSAALKTWMPSFPQERSLRGTVVCFPYAGGSSSAFAALEQRSSGCDLVAVELPGHLLRPEEALETDLHLLADRVAPIVASLSDRPVVLFGYSMGATLAFEVAQRLEDTGNRAHTLVVAAQEAPHKVSDIEFPSPDDDVELMTSIAKTYGTLAQAEEIIKSKPLLDMVAPMVRADFRALSNYRLRDQTPVTSDLIVCGGDQDPAVPFTALGDWAMYTMGHMSIEAFEGGHFFFQEHPDKLASLLCDLL